MVECGWWEALSVPRVPPCFWQEAMLDRKPHTGKHLCETPATRMDTKANATFSQTQNVLLICCHGTAGAPPPWEMGKCTVSYPYKNIHSLPLLSPAQGGGEWSRSSLPKQGKQVRGERLLCCLFTGKNSPPPIESWVNTVSITAISWLLCCGSQEKASANS